MRVSLGTTMSSASFSFLVRVIEGSTTVAVTVLPFTVTRLVPIDASGSQENDDVLLIALPATVPTALETRATITTVTRSGPEPAAFTWVPARSTWMVPPEPTDGAVTTHAASGAPFTSTAGLACSTRSPSRVSTMRASTTEVPSGIVAVMV